MARWSVRCAAVIAAALTGAASAGAQPPEQPGYRWTGFLGARLFSSTSALGTPTSTSLASSIAFGVRVARALGGAFAIEAELPLVLTGTRDDRALALMVDPRIHAAAEVRAGPNLRPFALVGIGAPSVLSSDRPAFASDIQPEAYLGVGARFPRARGWSVRLDVRLALVPARGDAAVTPELEVLVGLFGWGAGPPPRPPPPAEEIDRDADGIDAAHDDCDDRPEDRDGYQDDDGCPDIDDDGDEQLDIADRCRTKPETWNGYRDDDGCPDEVPAEVVAIAGVIRGLAFSPGSAVLPPAAAGALDHLAEILRKHPSVRGLIIGHTDDRGSPDQRLELSQQRAESVRFYLIARGIAEDRLGAVGVGSDRPLGDNATTEGRARNNRVEFQIRRRD